MLSNICIKKMGLPVEEKQHSKRMLLKRVILPQGPHFYSLTLPKLIGGMYQEQRTDFTCMLSREKESILPDAVGTFPKLCKSCKS